MSRASRSQHVQADRTQHGRRTTRTHRVVRVGSRRNELGADCAQRRRPQAPGRYTSDPRRERRGRVVPDVRTTVSVEAAARANPGRSGVQRQRTQPGAGVGLSHPRGLPAARGGTSSPARGRRLQAEQLPSQPGDLQPTRRRSLQHALRHAREHAPPPLPPPPTGGVWTGTATGTGTTKQLRFDGPAGRYAWYVQSVRGAGAFRIEGTVP